MRYEEQTNLDGWKVHMSWERPIGGPVRMVIEPEEPGNPPEGGITSSVLRRVDPSEALERLRANNPSAAEVDPSRFDDLLAALVDDGVTDKFLAVFSAAYVSRLEAGESGVAATLAAIMNRSLPTARGYIREARRRGLLTGGAGRAWGTITDKTRKVLREAGINETGI